ncbi:hypothetical protein PW52_05735 [Tamlana sedimentorum]|uniref:Uncharacterized protein n=1 Tax=Neotamlana sedimentorum TaxID=1435349 RepID=A0A0D7WEE4_9FLAO|nr:hypothetical protein [Tamlana sedimentorum]KJD36112.1 hypothetical protein PW52_05735 [Tamlana sedimentorum]
MENENIFIKLKTLIIPIIVTFAIGIIIGYFLDKRGEKLAKFSLVSGKHKLSIELDQERISDEDLLNQLFSKEWSKNATKAWLKENKEIYFYKDLELTSSIKKLNPENDFEISNGFQDLSIKRLGPWSYMSDTINVGFPAIAPKEGLAFGCETGKYFRNKVKLYSLNGKNEVIVDVTNRYECPDGIKAPDIQISKEDRLKLFGDTPVNKTEKVYALILP